MANGGPSNLDKEWATCLGCLQVLPKWQSVAGQLAWKKVAHSLSKWPIFMGFDGSNFYVVLCSNRDAYQSMLIQEERVVPLFHTFPKLLSLHTGSSKEFLHETSSSSNACHRKLNPLRVCDTDVILL